MLYPRIIPCLLLKDNGLVKTVQFKKPTYVGDPINAVKIFNEKEVDELVVLDIDASVLGVQPNFRLIEKIAAECRMPLCYGGGVKTVEQVKQIIELGVEKVALSSAVVEDPEIVSNAAKVVGSQSVVAVLDVKKGLSGKYRVHLNNGTKKTGFSPLELAMQFEGLGAGEIIVNSIDRDGVMGGYDLKLVEMLASRISVPLTFLGGAGELGHLKSLFTQYGYVGAAAGSLFVFKGKYKAVLINYPNRLQKMELFS